MSELSYVLQLGPAGTKPDKDSANCGLMYFNLLNIDTAISNILYK